MEKVLRNCEMRGAVVFKGSHDCLFISCVEAAKSYLKQRLGEVWGRSVGVSLGGASRLPQVIL